MKQTDHSLSEKEYDEEEEIDVCDDRDPYGSLSRAIVALSLSIVLSALIAGIAYFSTNYLVAEKEADTKMFTACLEHHAIPVYTWGWRVKCDFHTEK